MRRATPFPQRASAVRRATPFPQREAQACQPWRHDSTSLFAGSFDKFASALSSMLRDVVPDHERCVRDARGRAVQEAEAAELTAAAQDKAAAKLAKKEKLRKEAAERKERLAAKTKKSDTQEERTSGDAAETGPTRAPESPTYPDANLHSSRRYQAPTSKV